MPPNLRLVSVCFLQAEPPAAVPPTPSLPLQLPSRASHPQPPLPSRASHPQPPLPSLSASSHLTMGPASIEQSAHGRWLAALRAAARACTPMQLEVLRKRVAQMQPAMGLPRIEAVAFLAAVEPPIAPHAIAQFMEHVWKGPGQAEGRGGTFEPSPSPPLDGDGTPHAAQTTAELLHEALLAPQNAQGSSQADARTLGCSSQADARTLGCSSQADARTLGCSSQADARTTAPLKAKTAFSRSETCRK